jgi:hypothetical protein
MDFSCKPQWCSYSCEGTSLGCWSSGQDSDHCKGCGFFTGGDNYFVPREQVTVKGCDDV